MKTVLKHYKLLIVAVLVALCMSSCYVYPAGGYGGGYHRPHRGYYYGY